MISNTIWIALISAGFVFRDAKRQNMPRPLAWMSAVLLFWIAALPCYLWRRRRHKQALAGPNQDCTKLKHL